MNVSAVPSRERTGQVFKLGLFRRIRPADWKEKTSKVGCRIGMAAKIVVATDVRTGKQKFASLHDLRRSFGERWSHEVLPQILRELMRHESISTTLNFYVGRNAERTWGVLQSVVQSSTMGWATRRATPKNVSESTSATC